MWRLRSPTFCSLQAGDSAKLVGDFHFESEGLIIRGAKGVNPCPGHEKTSVPAEAGRKKTDAPFLCF